MAQMTFSSGTGIRPFRSPWGAFPTAQYPLSTGVSSAACYLGRIMTTDQTHQVKASTAVDAPSIVGVAAETNSTGSSGTYITVWDCNPNLEFQIGSSGSIASTLIGSFRVLQWDSTLNIQYLASAGSTAADNRVVVTGLVEPTAIGDTNGMVSFRFLQDIQPGSTVPSSIVYLAYYPR